MHVTCACVLLLMGYFSPSYGCGLSWGVPQDHFNGVNGKGFVSYFEKIGELDLGDNLKFPLIINFNSGNERISPYLGKSFSLCFLEANMVETGDNSFMATFPDGSLNLFIRNNSNETVLQGSAGWRSEINGDIINAYAPCGWKLSYYKGHILSITTPKNRKLEFVYSGNLVTAVRENGAARLTVEQDTATGLAKALIFNGKRMEIALDQKPKVQNIAGQNVVGSIDQSLKSLNPSTGTSATFEFAVNEKVQPTLKITNREGVGRLFTWDPRTKQVISDTVWTYKITVNRDGGREIQRINTLGQSESWFKDANKGIETIKGLGGSERVTERFTSGALAGRVRRVTEKYDGAASYVRSIYYDENAEPIRARYTEISNGVQIVDRVIGNNLYADVLSVSNRKKAIEAALDHAKTSTGRDLLVYQLASLKLLADGDIEGAKKLAGQIGDDEQKVTILLQAELQDPNHTDAEKAIVARGMLKSFPDQADRITTLLQYLMMSMKNNNQ